MLNPSALKGRTYADRPLTPLGVETGLTSTPVSERPSRGATPRPNAAPNPYHYQPAITSSRPELTARRRSSANYAKAHAESLAKSNSPVTESPVTESPDNDDVTFFPRPGRSYSFSAEDLKRSHHNPLMQDDAAKQQDEEEDENDDKEKRPLQSPGVGNSEVKGREFGFTSVP